MQITRCTELAWLRKPTDKEELKEFSPFVAKHGLAAYCRLLLNSNEFLFVN